MKLFEQNTGKKIKTVAIIYFVAMIVYTLIYLYQGISTIAEVNELLSAGFTGVSVGAYYQALILGLIPRAMVILAAFPIYGFGKLVEKNETATEPVSAENEKAPEEVKEEAEKEEI